MLYARLSYIVFYCTTMLLQLVVLLLFYAINSKQLFIMTMIVNLAIIIMTIHVLVTMIILMTITQP